MAKLLKVAPTKSALLALKRQVNFLQNGHDLLERKRELLTRLVYEQLTVYRKLRHQARSALAEAYESLALTHLRMGTRMLRQAALGLEPAVRVKILPRSSLGVEYPSVNVEPLPLQPVSLLWTESSLDDTRSRLAALAAMLGRLGQAETTLRRMLAEQRKTQKRVNALKYNIIPRYRATIRFIQSALEEEERNTLFQIKLLRERDEA
jgi:V/A-type H+-transporting ATPase subunit D